MSWGSVMEYVSHNYCYTADERRNFDAIEAQNRAQAAAIVNSQIELYKAAVGLKGDVMLVPDGYNRINDDFGYYRRQFTANYEGIDINKKWSKRWVYEDGDDRQKNCYTEEAHYCTREYVNTVTHKIVQFGKSGYVKELEEKFKKSSTLYYDICAGYATQHPKMSITILYNMLNLLFCLFMLFYLFTSPRIIPEYAASISVDVMLYKFISNYNKLLLSVPIYMVYVSFGVGIVCIIVSMCLRNYFVMFVHHFKIYHLITILVVSIVMFAFSYCCNNDVRILATETSFVWIPIAIYGGSRIIVLLCTICLIIATICNLITKKPYNILASKVTARAKYIDSGEYEHSKKLIEEIRSYSVNNITEYFIENAMNAQSKIAEFTNEIAQLKSIEARDFVDKSAEINELNIRLEKAKAAIVGLLYGKSDNISG